MPDNGPSFQAKTASRAIGLSLATFASLQAMDLPSMELCSNDVPESCASWFRGTADDAAITQPSMACESKDCLDLLLVFLSP